MKIAPLNQRVTVEERQIMQDEIGNERSDWQPLFSRWASVNLANYDEVFEAGTTQTKVQLVVTLRYDSKLASLDTKQVRLVFEGKSYNILSLDHVRFNHRMIKLRVEEEDES